MRIATLIAIAVLALVVATEVDGAGARIVVDCPLSVELRNVEKHILNEVLRELDYVYSVSIESSENVAVATITIADCREINVSMLRMLGIEDVEIVDECSCARAYIENGIVEVSLRFEGFLEFATSLILATILNLAVSKKIVSSSRRGLHLSMVLGLVALITMASFFALMIATESTGCVALALNHVLGIRGANLPIVSAIALIAVVILPSTPSIIYAVATYRRVSAMVRATVTTKMVRVLHLVPLIVYVATFTPLVLLQVVEPPICVAIALLTTLGSYELASTYLAKKMCRHTKMFGVDVCIVENGGFVAMQIGLIKRTVVLSEELAKVLDRDELRAVIAHEYAHLRGFHQLLSSLIHFAAISLLIAYVPRIVDYVLANVEDPCMRGLSVLALCISPLAISLVINVTLRRYLESRADRYAAKVAGSEALARALMKIHGSVNPSDSKDLARKIFEKVLDSHPPLRKRISILDAEEWKRERIEDREA